MLASVPGVADVQVFGDGAHVRVTQGDAAKAAADLNAALQQHGIRPLAVRAVPPSLEDVFIDLVTRAS